MPTSAGMRDISSAHCADEELVFLYRRQHEEAAKGILVERYLDTVFRWISQQLRAPAFSKEDREDARQAGVIWLVRAIKRCDPNRLHADHGRSFVSYLRIFIRRRCAEFVRRLPRSEKHLDRGIRTEDLLESAPERVRRRAQGAEEAAALAEDAARVAALLAKRSEADRRLWRLVCLDIPARCIARILGITEQAAKSRRRRLRTKLAAELRKSGDVE